MNSRQVTDLINRVRMEYPRQDPYSRINNSYQAHKDLNLLAETLEAEHQRAERYRDIARRSELQCQDAEAERDALRAENRKLLDKLETAMGVSEENDTLRAVLDDIQLEYQWTKRKQAWDRRAIDTKEKP